MVSSKRFAAVLAGIAGGTALAVAATAQQAAPSIFAQPGYIAREDMLDMLKLIPPAPKSGTLAAIRDEEAAGKAVALRNSPRWEQARIDANLAPENATDAFSCAAGFPIGPQTTPALNALLLRAAVDLGTATAAAKDFYKRPRPFMVNREATCTTEQEGALRQSGAYPSGHAAIGYGWGLLMAEVVPNRATQLIARGEAFADSRRVCNVHWQSDVEQGEMVGSAVVARLHASADFQKDLKKVRDELKKKLAKLPAPDCTRENAALGGG